MIAQESEPSRNTVKRDVKSTFSRNAFMCESRRDIAETVNKTLRNQLYFYIQFSLVFGTENRPKNVPRYIEKRSKNRLRTKTSQKALLGGSWASLGLSQGPFGALPGSSLGCKMGHERAQKGTKKGPKWISEKTLKKECTVHFFFKLSFSVLQSPPFLRGVCAGSCFSWPLFLAKDSHACCLNVCNVLETVHVSKPMFGVSK